MILVAILGRLQFLLFPLFSAVAFTALVQAQNPDGFISIDCGLPNNAPYTDSTTGLSYVADDAFVETGVNKNIASEYVTNNINEQLKNLRSFPNGSRNCYNIGVRKGQKYLVRAYFMYGNYDGLNQQPQFDMYIGANKWVNVNISDASEYDWEEIIYVPKLNYIEVCLVNIESGVPFISALELRPLNNSAYEQVTQFGTMSLVTFNRLDRGSTTDEVRYPDDVYDRIWNPNYKESRWENISTLEKIDAKSHNEYHPASIVMRTASTPKNASEAMEFRIGNTISTAFEFYTYMHFAEVLELDNQLRQFNIYLKGDLWYGPVNPKYLETTTAHGPPLPGGQFEFSLSKTGGSTEPPLLNAIEYYYAIQLSQAETAQTDVEAMAKIKLFYGITRNWQGDPCAPKDFMWEGIRCKYDNDGIPPAIVSMNLSSSGLTGQIAPEIANLKLLESLDLSNNNLTGSVPDFLSQLSSLKVLNLAGNNLSGSVPSSLIEKSNQNLLDLSVGGNPNLCFSNSCNGNEGKNVIIPVAASIAGVLFAIAALCGILFYIHKKGKQVSEAVEVKGNNIENQSLYSIGRGRQFTYSEVMKITNNSQRVLGKGGFGTVYHGYLDDAQVAVKMLSSLSVQGYKQFQAEVQLLLRVHHRNLTTLVGFCKEDNNMALIYEFMANGDLEKHLSGPNRNVLNWDRRLLIAVEAAKGLEYLHNGSKPPMVHRDVKTSNILLNEHFQAKLGDFGVSRSFSVEGGSHVTTVVAGSPGYLDPEYSVTYRLSEKSDVYSYGIVLLRIITGRPVITRQNETNVHITQWVSHMLANGDIKSVVDPNLGGDFDTNSSWKVVEIAMACASATSDGRPTMHQVVSELNECLAAGLRQDLETIDSIELLTETMPLAR